MIFSVKGYIVKKEKVICLNKNKVQYNPKLYFRSAIYVQLEWI